MTGRKIIYEKEQVSSKLEYNIDFRPDYEKILLSFGFKELDDARSRDKLRDLLLSTNWHGVIKEFVKRIKNKWVVVAGCGPTGPIELQEVIRDAGDRLKVKYAFIAADGASRYLIQQNIIPTAVFSDLDGITPELMRDLNQNDTIFVIHAHGDNLNAIETFKMQIKLSRWIIGTTQTVPKHPLINPGGFTDGDRILYFLSHLPPTFKILLIGMDFGIKVGQYSKIGLTSDVLATPIKLKKLTIAVELLSKLLPTMLQPIYGLEHCYPFPGLSKFDTSKLD